MGTQLLVESPVLFSQMSAVRFSVFPLKEVPPFTSEANPASCSGVEMSKEVWEASYHVMSVVPSQMVCADSGAVTKPSVKTVSKRSNVFFICEYLMLINCYYPKKVKNQAANLQHVFKRK